jgi:hypothetical protein
MSIDVKIRCPQKGDTDYDHLDIVLNLDNNMTIQELTQYLISMDIILNSNLWYF